jgi:ABC-type branched-subunit amino acid transport system ATPase component
MAAPPKPPCDQGIQVEQGTTILLVEQNGHSALSLTDRGYVMETG